MPGTALDESLDLVRSPHDSVGANLDRSRKMTALHPLPQRRVRHGNYPEHLRARQQADGEVLFVDRGYLQPPFSRASLHVVEEAKVIESGRSLRTRALIFPALLYEAMSESD